MTASGIYLFLLFTCLRIIHSSFKSRVNVLTPRPPPWSEPGTRIFKQATRDRADLSVNYGRDDQSGTASHRQNGGCLTPIVYFGGVSHQPVRMLLHGEYRASSDRCGIDPPTGRSQIGSSCIHLQTGSAKISDQTRGLLLRPSAAN